MYNRDAWYSLTISPLIERFNAWEPSMGVAEARAERRLTRGVHSFIFRVNTSDSRRTMAKTLTMRLDDKTYETFVRAAKAERRSLANLVETAALRHIEESSFVDDVEMAEILSRPELVKR
jgi:hypothetical protein